MRESGGHSSKRSRPAAISALLAVAAFLVASAADAESPQKENPTAQFSEAARVDVVNIGVRVTDHNGLPVDGLQPTEFELLVDGKQVPIVNFFAMPKAPISPSDHRTHPLSEGPACLLYTSPSPRDRS